MQCTTPHSKTLFVVSVPWFVSMQLCDVWDFCFSGYYNINDKMYCDVHAKQAAKHNPPAPNMVPVTVKPWVRGVSTMAPVTIKPWVRGVSTMAAVTIKPWVRGVRNFSKMLLIWIKKVSFLFSIASVTVKRWVRGVSTMAPVTIKPWVGDEELNQKYLFHINRFYIKCKTLYIL